MARGVPANSFRVTLKKSRSCEKSSLLTRTNTPVRAAKLPVRVLAQILVRTRVPRPLSFDWGSRAPCRCPAVARARCRSVALCLVRVAFERPAPVLGMADAALAKGRLAGLARTPKGASASATATPITILLTIVVDSGNTLCSAGRLRPPWPVLSRRALGRAAARGATRPRRPG